MKKMMKKWRKLLNETKPTEKYFGNVPRKLNPQSPKDQSYNRAITSMMGQSDFRSTFKVWLGGFMKNSKRSGDIEHLAEKIKDFDKQQAGKDLNIMRYIYSGKSNFDIYTKDNIKTGIMYDNQPEVTGSPVEKIDFVLEQFNIPVSHEVPSADDLEEVYIYYIHPNWHLTKAKPVPDEIKQRFKKNIALSQTSDFMKRQAELDAQNRQREIERRRELAKRRRERRRNK